MRKLFRYLFLGAIIFIMASCAEKTDSAYNPQKCEELMAKIGNKEELSEADYNEMIDQLVAGIQVIDEKKKEIGEENKEKQKEFILKKENQKMVENILGFVFYLESHKKDLSSENVEKLDQAYSDLQKLRD